MSEFKTVFDEFSLALRRYIARNVSDSAAVDDILQEVFIKAYKNSSKLKSQEKLKSWLFTIAKNTITDHYRADKRTELLAEDAAQETLEPSFYDELSGCVRHFAQALPAGYSEVLEAYEFEELSAQQIAQKLDIPLSTVKSKIQRGRKKIKDALFECCSFEFDRDGKPVDFAPKCCTAPSCFKN